MEDGRKDQDLAGVMEKMQALVHRSEVQMSTRRESALDARKHSHYSPWHLLRTRKNSVKQKNAAVSYEWAQRLNS